MEVSSQALTIDVHLNCKHFVIFTYLRKKEEAYQPQTRKNVERSVVISSNGYLFFAWMFPCDGVCERSYNVTPTLIFSLSKRTLVPERAQLTNRLFKYQTRNWETNYFMISPSFFLLINEKYGNII